jgi:hypothetical protein
MTEKNEQQRERTIHRVEKLKDYSIIANHGALNAELSWGAKGLLWHMLTRPDDWAFYNEELTKHSPESIRVTKKLIKELKEAGYVAKVPKKDPVTKRVVKWETVLFEKPVITEKPEVQFPEGGSSHRVENVPLLSTDIKLNTDLPLNTDIKDIPVGEQAPEITNLPVPKIQEPTAKLFLLEGKKPKLSDDDISCLKMLFNIHTPAAIQEQITKSFKRLKEKGSVRVDFEGKEYVITKPETLPIRYIYNSMKNWSSLRGAGKGGKRVGTTGKNNKGNPSRENKDYAKGAAPGMFIE